MCSDCDGYGLKKHGITRSDCTRVGWQRTGGGGGGGWVGGRVGGWCYCGPCPG